MESLLPLILALFLLVKGIEYIIALANLAHLRRYGDRVPNGFAGWVDAATLSRMREYTLAHGRVNLLSSAMNVLLTVLFIFGGLLNWYNSWLAGLGWPAMITALCFFLFLAYADFLLNMPFDLYNTFVIEEKYGFNRQTFTLWLTDAVKGLLLTTVLYSLLLWVALWLITMLPGSWWWLLWLFLLGFKLFMLYISPYVIEPLFNKFTPIADKSLEEKIRQLLAKAGLSISRVFTMDASKRSGHGNAYFSGIGRVKRIVLFDTLLGKNSEDEILGILAHEAGHWKKKHILKMLMVMECVSFVALFCAWLLMQGDTLAVVFRISQPTMQVKLLLMGFCASIAAFPARPLFNYASRRHEWEADGFAARLTGNPHALARALARLGRDNLANLHPHPWYIILHYSHPPLPQRVRTLLASWPPAEGKPQ